MGEEERRGRNVVIKYNFKNKQTNKQQTTHKIQRRVFIRAVSFCTQLQ